LLTRKVGNSESTAYVYNANRFRRELRQANGEVDRLPLRFANCFGAQILGAAENVKSFELQAASRDFGYHVGYRFLVDAKLLRPATHLHSGRLQLEARVYAYGNAGAQALAVTMRGLALREISTRHWFRVLFKETRVGIINGLAIAATTSAAVLVFGYLRNTENSGLALVIGIAMVLSMVIAGIAGAVIPIALTRVGLDPAQSSTIVLTTVTDVAGFFSFLGIAALLSGLL